MEQIHCEWKEQKAKSDSDLDSVPNSIDVYIRLLSQQLEIYSENR